LKQVLWFEPAAGPTVSLFKLNSDKVIGHVLAAVYYPGMALIAGKLQMNKGFGRDLLVNFQTSAGRGYVFKNRPFAAICA